MCRQNLSPAYSLDEIIEAFLDGSYTDEQSRQLFELGPEAVKLATLAADLRQEKASYRGSLYAERSDLLSSITQPTDHRVEARHLSGDRWEITISAFDHLGTLSLIAGHLTSRRIHIFHADVVTLSDESGARGKILNVFDVRAPGVDPESNWDELREALSRSIQLAAQGEVELAHEEVVDRVSSEIQLSAGEYEPLLPIEISFDNHSTPTLTELHVSSVETPGFLFAFSKALTLLDVDIQQARIRTASGGVEDTFWIRDAQGQKITSATKMQQVRTASALIKQFAYLLPLSADPNQALRQFKDMIIRMLRDGSQMRGIDHLRSSDTLRTLAKMMGVSQHLWEDFLRMQHENLFPMVTDQTHLDQEISGSDLAAQLATESAALASDQDRIDHLNRFKDREMFRADLRHITGRIGNERFCREISTAAEVAVAQTATFTEGLLQTRHGRPWLGADRACRWSVLALGKCGGREMGFASDIELMFIYEGSGKTQGASPRDNQEYFIDWVCDFLKCWEAPKEGIFDIDLRLRPHGHDGMLATSVEAFRDYYHVTGGARQFERMALVKLRPVAGDTELGIKILKMRDAFVYADQALDLTNIRHLRDRQAAELVESGIVNAKYSSGGLVDLEYFVQACQIEAGRDRPELRVPNTLAALAGLEGAGLIQPERALAFRQAYGLLRRLIDGLRMVRGNAKDLSIPEADSPAFKYLTRRLGYATPSSLHLNIEDAMQFGRELWVEADGESI